jgi:hypothetical protein
MSRILVLLLALALLASACDLDKGKEEARASSPCAAPAPTAMSGSPRLPSGFPRPNGVTYSSSEAAGPSTIVGGFSTIEIRDLWNTYKSGLGSNGYSVTRSEFDGPDGEVDWSGHATTGEVKVVAACVGRTTFTITVRPA